jgi:carbon storage regulator
MPNRNRRRGLTQGGIFLLLLSRKLGERILVPHCELAVSVIAVEGKAVRLGISAPEDIAVYREEVWQQLHQQAPGPPPKGERMQEGSGIIDQGNPRGAASLAPAPLYSGKRPDREQSYNGATPHE